MLKMAVMIKQVPDSQDITIDPVTKTLNRTQARNIVNPPDMNALEAALQLKDKYGGEITVITMGAAYGRFCTIGMYFQGSR